MLVRLFDGSCDHLLILFAFFCQICLKFLFAHLLQISCICGRRHLQPCPLWTLIVVIFDIIIDHLLYFLERGTSRKMTMILEKPEERFHRCVVPTVPRLDMDCMRPISSVFPGTDRSYTTPLDLNGTGSLHGWYPSGYHPASRRSWKDPGSLIPHRRSPRPHSQGSATDKLSFPLP